MATVNTNQCEVVLVGCGAPNRGMGWYHAEQMLKNQCPSAKLCYIVEPWFLGGGTLFLFFLLFCYSTIVFVEKGGRSIIKFLFFFFMFPSFSCHNFFHLD